MVPLSWFMPKEEKGQVTIYDGLTLLLFRNNLV
jgi:hypothetical protein